MKPKSQTIVGPHITTVLSFYKQLETMQSRADRTVKELSSRAKTAAWPSTHSPEERKNQ